MAWEIGDLCIINDQNADWWSSFVYVITRLVDFDVPAHSNIEPSLCVRPVFGFFVDVADKHERSVNVNKCKPISIVELGTLYVKLGNFMVDIARQRSETG